MSQFYFSFNTLAGMNLNGQGDKEYIVEALAYCATKITQSSDFIMNLADGQVVIGINTHSELMAARATLLFFKKQIEDIARRAEGKSDVWKFYSNFLVKYQSNFKATSVADEFLKSYFAH